MGFALIRLNHFFEAMIITMFVNNIIMSIRTSHNKLQTSQNKFVNNVILRGCLKSQNLAVFNLCEPLCNLCSFVVQLLIFTTKQHKGWRKGAQRIFETVSYNYCAILMLCKYFGALPLLSIISLVVFPGVGKNSKRAFHLLSIISLVVFPG